MCVAIPLPSPIREIHGIDHADHRRIDGGVGASDGSHRGKAFGGEEYALADARVHSVERKHGIAAVGAVEIERLDDENLPPFMRGRFLGRNNITDDAAN